MSTTSKYDYQDIIDVSPELITQTKERLALSVGSKVTETKLLTYEELDRFQGGGDWHTLPFGDNRNTYTDGILHLAEKGGFHWLVSDVLTVHLYEAKKRHNDYMYFFKLSFTNGGKGVLTCDDGNRNVFYTFKLDYIYVDADFNTLQLYACENHLGGFTLMLPSEY